MRPEDLLYVAGAIIFIMVLAKVVTDFIGDFLDGSILSRADKILILIFLLTIAAIKLFINLFL